MGRLFKWLIPLALITFGLLWPLVLSGGSEASDISDPVVFSNYKADFVVNSDGLSISAHRASTGALLDSLQIGDFNGAVSAQDIVNALVVDPYDDVIYVGRRKVQSISI